MWNYRLKVLILFIDQMEAKVFFKYGTIYREVLYMRRIDWCQAMMVKPENKMLLQTVQLINDSAPSFVHECPYTVKLLFDRNKIYFS